MEPLAPAQARLVQVHLPLPAGTQIDGVRPCSDWVEQVSSGGQVDQGLGGGAQAAGASATKYDQSAAQVEQELAGRAVGAEQELAGKEICGDRRGPVQPASGGALASLPSFASSCRRPALPPHTYHRQPTWLLAACLLRPAWATSDDRRGPPPTTGFNDRLALGYAYPVYGCYKTLERHQPEIEQLRFWCQYWILVASLTVVERFADRAVSWLPMYGEAKLALVVYLWHPNTRGAGRVYEGYLRPLLARHGADIDRGLLEMRARARDLTASQLKAAASVGQGWLVEIASRVSSQLQAARSGRGRAGDLH
ncbi:hypothetical protein ACQ4PT_066563 [Festuca glaucescens]